MFTHANEEQEYVLLSLPNDFVMFTLLTLSLFWNYYRNATFATTTCFVFFRSLSFSDVVISGTLRHRWLPVNEVMLLKGHVTLLATAPVAITSLS